VEFAIATPRAQGALPRSPFRTLTLPDGTRSTEFYRLGPSYLLRFPGLADFEVSADGLAVTCRPTPETTEATSRHLYLNQVLPLVLGRLGKMVFHASAVETDGWALAFVAKSTGGKSTLAASFGAAGAAVLTDESLVLEEPADGYRVLPGHPSVRLWDDSERELLGPGVRAEPPLPFTPKRRIVGGPRLRFATRPAPLRRVYFLGGGQAPAVTLEPMSAPEVMLELVKTSFLLNVDDRSRLISHFDTVARLARRPIHHRLDFPRRFDLLPEVRQAVLQHARDESAS